VEARKANIKSIGIEAHPMAHFATTVKVDWAPEPDALIQAAESLASQVSQELARVGLNDSSLVPLNETPCDALRQLPPEASKLLLANSISPLPLHKTLVLRDAIEEHLEPGFQAHARLALANALVTSIGNLHFGPEVGVGPRKLDAAVIEPWLRGVRIMSEDLRILRMTSFATAEAIHADSRQTEDLLPPNSVDAVITSPPYPNEKDYTRTTRLESVVLGFFHNLADLRALKKTMVRSNTRGIYRGDDDDEWAARFPEIQKIAESIEQRRLDLGKTSGFERMYPRVTRLYFGGMARHLADLRKVLRPGAQLAYVVGDQASYLQVMIRTGTILAHVAQTLGYELIGIDLFRTRLATATRQMLREEVVVLRWPGP
jgi:hypothetical protein